MMRGAGQTGGVWRGEQCVVVCCGRFAVAGAYWLSWEWIFSIYAQIFLCNKIGKELDKFDLHAPYSWG
jgi:hypothetical protein